ncbi:hypothetical protein CHELA40_15255 [Chelatococcus asaccharovorans]|nr:hypothetical protein CHELA17_60363 [Chelatococcus asaccharovorans]CAH1681968.1 hypothetical protein CHELA40_15255 [Chelatococcus asaccharovorans]
MSRRCPCHDGVIVNAGGYDLTRLADFRSGDLQTGALRPGNNSDNNSPRPAIPRGRGRRIVFSCKAGARSAQAVALMRQAGHRLREPYRGDFTDWLARVGPVASRADDWSASRLLNTPCANRHNDEGFGIVRCSVCRYLCALTHL